MSNKSNRVAWLIAGAALVAAVHSGCGSNSTGSGGQGFTGDDASFDDSGSGSGSSSGAGSSSGSSSGTGSSSGSTSDAETSNG